MIEFTRDVRPSMALDLHPHDAQKNQAPLTPTMLFMFISNGEAWAVKLNGKLVAIGGHAPIWNGRTVLWGFLGEDSGPAMIAMTREIKKQIARLHVDFQRIEAYTERHHKEGHRWLRLLGFKHEGIMRKFYNGVDHSMYGRVV